MNDDILAKVKEWLSTQGYSFEIKSAQLCSSAGFGVQLGNFSSLGGTNNCYYFEK